MVFIPATCLDHSVSTGAWESQMQPPCGCHTWQNTKFFWQSLLNYVGWWTASYTASTADSDFFNRPLSSLFDLTFIVIFYSHGSLAMHGISFHYVPLTLFKGSRQETYRGICRQGNRKSASVEFAKPTASLCLPTKLETDEVHWNILVFPFCAVNTLAVTNDL